MSELNFWKMHGLGNDFIVFDGVKQTLNPSTDFIKRIADRNFGIGCDQVLIIENSKLNECDFRYRIFNADGLEVEQCGNGARCAAIFVKQYYSIDKNPLTFETSKAILTLRTLDNDWVEVDMGLARFAPTTIPLLSDKTDAPFTLMVCDTDFHGYAVNMGNPHFIIPVDHIDSVPIEQCGFELATHSDFPEGCNISFAQIRSPDDIHIKTFERGVGATLACGSAACATVAALARAELCRPTTIVTMPGGKLSITYHQEHDNVIMTGPATFVFAGKISGN